jgi:putative flippase GtrA
VPTRQAPQASTPEARVLRAPNIRRARRADWEQLVRFCLVGGIGYVVNLVVFSLLVHGADTHYALAAVVAFCVAWTNNFLFNKFWTFRRHELSTAQQGARYLAVSLVALGLNLIILEVLVRAGMPEVSAQAIAIAAVMPVNFLLNRRWSFR